jgi:hypothetical protein
MMPCARGINLSQACFRIRISVIAQAEAGHQDWISRLREFTRAQEPGFGPSLSHSFRHQFRSFQAIEVITPFQLDS